MLVVGDMRILAIGAAGDFAGHVVPALVSRGTTVRGLIPRPEQAETNRITRLDSTAAAGALTFHFGEEGAIGAAGGARSLAITRLANFHLPFCFLSTSS